MLILCVQIGCIRCWRRRSRITVAIAAAAFQGPFKVYQPVLATTFLNGHQKTKESNKETTSRVCRGSERNTLSSDKGFTSCCYLFRFNLSNRWQAVKETGDVYNPGIIVASSVILSMNSFAIAVLESTAQLTHSDPKKERTLPSP